MSEERDPCGGKLHDSAIVRAVTETVLEWGNSYYQPFPWREDTSPFHALIAEVLLQRTRAANVVPVYLNFTARFPSPDHLAHADISDIERVIYPLGLRWRAPLLKQLGQRLVSMGGAVPDDPDALLSLPAVGPYVAAAYLSFHAGKRSVIVDANVVRWLCRMVDVSMNGETRRKRWLRECADRLTPLDSWRAYNYGVLDFTMQICKPKPLCHKCPFSSGICIYGQKDKTASQEAL